MIHKILEKFTKYWKNLQNIGKIHKISEKFTKYRKNSQNIGNIHKNVLTHGHALLKPFRSRAFMTKFHKNFMYLKFSLLALIFEILGRSQNLPGRNHSISRENRRLVQKQID